MVSRRTVAVGLLAVLAVSLGAHLWGISHGLPVPDGDERYFVTPAVYVAASGHLNPHWFGHPGSTVIYPLAFVYRVRDVIEHGSPLLGPSPGLARTFQRDPGSFYFLGRLWAALFSIAAIPLVFAIGRRVFGASVGLLGAAAWAVIPLGVQYGQTTRTDAVAIFFGLLALWFCIRAQETARPSQFVGAGVASGLAVSTRYFLALLAVAIAASWVLARRRPNDEAPVVGALTLVGAIGAMAASFLLTTPFLVLDWPDAWRSIRAEATDPVIRHTGMLTNFRFYSLGAIPGSIGPLVVLAAASGIVVILKRRDPVQLFLLGYATAFVVLISAFALHWRRWALPVLPLFVLIAADALVTGAAACRRHARARVARSAVAAIAALLGVVALAGPAAAVLRLDRGEAQPSTIDAARRWFARTVPRTSWVATESKVSGATGSYSNVVEHDTLAGAGALGAYEAAGFRYLVVHHASYARCVRHGCGGQLFYVRLTQRATLVADFRARPGRPGPRVEIFRLPNRTVASGPVLGVGPRERSDEERVETSAPPVADVSARLARLRQTGLTHSTRACIQRCRALRDAHEKSHPIHPSARRMIVTTAGSARRGAPGVRPTPVQLGAMRP